MTRLALAVALGAAALGCGSKKQDSAPADAAAPVVVTVPMPVPVPVPAAPDGGVAPDPTAERTEHPVFALVDNRHAAHRTVDGDLVIDGGDIGFARYTRFGLPSPRWHLGKTIDGQRAAVADRLASLEVPLAAEQATGARQLTAHVYAGAGQLLGLKVNGRTAGPLRAKLVPGWQTITLPIADGRLAVGENQLVFESNGGNGNPAFAWLRLGPAGAPPATDPRAAATFDPTAGSLALADAAALTWFVTLPAGAHVVAEVAEPCRIEVRATANDATFAGGRLGGGATRVDLSKLGGRVVALTLTGRDCPRATAVAPRITLPGPAPVALPKGAPPKYVVLWVMDATRADRIPAFTPGARAHMPAFDELAKTSTVFRQYYVQGNESQTSHSSVWTGVYPAVHNVRTTGVGGLFRIPKRLPVLGEQAKAAGLVTTAVTGNGFVTDYGGYARGFDDFRNMMREKGVINGVIFAKDIVDEALRRLDRYRKSPTLLFLGTIDNHSPWIARKPWIDQYSPGKYRGPFQERGTPRELGMVRGKMGCGRVPPPADVERLRAIYDSALSYTDAQLGRFVAQLQAWGIWDETMLIVTADHGEELFEEHRCGHGGSLRETLVRVPLLVHYPAQYPAAFVTEGAEGVDVLPSILDALGAPVLANAQGTSLAPLAQGVGRGWARPSYASQYEYAHTMRIGTWKARVMKTGVPVIEDLATDPGEKRDLAATHSIERRMLTDNLGLFLALRKQWRKHEWGVTTSVTPAGAAALDLATTP